MQLQDHVHQVLVGQRIICRVVHLKPKHPPTVLIRVPHPLEPAAVFLANQGLGSSGLLGGVRHC